MRAPPWNGLMVTSALRLLRSILQYIWSVNTPKARLCQSRLLVKGSIRILVPRWCILPRILLQRLFRSPWLVTADVAHTVVWFRYVKVRSTRNHPWCVTLSWLILYRVQIPTHMSMFVKMTLRWGTKLRFHASLKNSSFTSCSVGWPRMKQWL